MMRAIIANSMIPVTLIASLALSLSTPTVAQELAPGSKPSERSREREKEKKLSPEREELRERFEARVERIDALKDGGAVGESFEGYVQPLHGRLLAKDDQALIDDENRDRKALYALVAEERPSDRKSVTARVIAERNASRKFEAARPEHFLFIDEGRWIRKRDMSRAQRIAKLKKDAVAGETWEGWLDASGRDISRETEALIKEENRARRAMYDEIAGRISKVSAGEIARDAAKATRERLAPGMMFKNKDGQWERQARAS